MECRIALEVADLFMGSFNRKQGKTVYVAVLLRNNQHNLYLC